MTVEQVDRPYAPVPGRVRLSWMPAPDTLRRMLAWFATGGGLIGLIGFAASFASVSQAARPYLGTFAFTLPVLVDLGIFTLSGLAIVLELHEIASWWVRLIPNALAGFTVYLNTATQPSWFGKAVHAAGPVLWVIVVEIATFTVRKMAGLSREDTMGKVRGSRWLLAPFSTFRLWRRMRLWEITDYRTAIGREHERAASVALLRQWYGRAWRGKAPRAERLAVRLQGSTDEPVADLLSRASVGITAAAAAAVKPDTDETSVAENTNPGVSENTGDAVPENTGSTVSQDAGSGERRALHAVPETPALPAGQYPGSREITGLRGGALLAAARQVEQWRGMPSATRISKELGVGMPLAVELANLLRDEEEASGLEDSAERVSTGRNLTPAQVADLIRDGGGTRPGVREVMRTFAVSYDKAKTALGLLENAA